jgi:hypothetical protein
LGTRAGLFLIILFRLSAPLVDPGQSGKDEMENNNKHEFSSRRWVFDSPSQAQICAELTSSMHLLEITTRDPKH